MLKWQNNFIQVCKEGVAGMCPCCGSEDTDYLFHQYKDGRGWLDMWCSSCNERAHADFRTIPHNRKYVQYKEQVVEENKALA